jgi:Na+-transporting methylmalonyl-CoA/oxaloacetate decarboxylase gamma subunit
VTVVLLLLALACYGVSALRHSATAAGQPEAAPEELPVQKKPEGAAKPVLKVHALVEEVDVKNNTVTAVIVDGNLSHAEALAALLVELVERSPNKRKATTIVNLSLAKDVKVPRDALITDAGKINLNALQHKILTLQLTVGPRGLVVVGILPGSRGGDKMAAFHMEFEPGKIMYEMYDKKADDKPIVRVYSVSDLVGRSDQVDADHLIQVITRVIEPASWDVMGGSATVQYYPLGKSLVISQSAAAHERVQTLLDALRKAKAAQEKSQK